MGLREQLMDDLKDAMRQHDEVRKRAIRSVLAAVKQAETELDSDGNRVTLDDDGILARISRQVRQRQESIDAFRAGGRLDLVAEEEAERAILEDYLPQPLSRDEIVDRARRVIADVGAAGIQDIGKVMRPLMAGLKGQADGRVVNEIVRDLLADI